MDLESGQNRLYIFSRFRLGDDAISIRFDLTEVYSQSSVSLYMVYRWTEGFSLGKGNSLITIGQGNL